MNIRSLGGDIADVAPKHAECAALWLRSGFNYRYTAWRFKLANGERELTPMDHEAPIKRPWESEQDSLWKLHPPIGRLRYLYVFANPDNALAYRGLPSIDAAITRCLDRMATIGVTSVAMILIPAVEYTSSPTPEDETRSAQEMIRSISTWEAEHPWHQLDIFLVDLKDDFAALLPE